MMNAMPDPAILSRNGDMAAPPAKAPHTSVMADEVIEALQPRDGGVYVDGTFGAGGYTRALLASAACFVCAIDRDPHAVAIGRRLARDYPGRLMMIQGRFGDMATLLSDRGIEHVDGVALDLGVSSMQLDDAERGFSIRHDGPIDMRMDDTDEDGPTAADLVNCWSERELREIISRYGEERRAGAVARAIVRARLDGPIATTHKLAEVVRRAVTAGQKPTRGRGPDKVQIDPATRTFQALRVKVNDEIGQLEKGLEAAERMLLPTGRLAVVSFQSLEDRAVKSFLRVRSGAAPNPSRHLPDVLRRPPPTFRMVAGKLLRPSAREVDANPRARSAKLRIAERTGSSVVPTGPRGALS